MACIGEARGREGETASTRQHCGRKLVQVQARYSQRAWFALNIRRCRIPYPAAKPRHSAPHATVLFAFRRLSPRLSPSIPLNFMSPRFRYQLLFHRSISLIDLSTFFFINSLLFLWSSLGIFWGFFEEYFILLISFHLFRCLYSEFRTLLVISDNLIISIIMHCSVINVRKRYIRVICTLQAISFFIFSVKEFGILIESLHGGLKQRIYHSATYLVIRCTSIYR